jgi:hypothetical protein
MKNKSAYGLLRNIKVDDSFDEDQSLLSSVDEDDELIKIVAEREHQEEINIDLDDL